VEVHPYFWLSRAHDEGHSAVTKEVAERVVGEPASWEPDSDQEGGTRYYGYVPEMGEWVRVIVLADGRLFNAFVDAAAKGRVYRRRKRGGRRG
jgi:hypothetical protein